MAAWMGLIALGLITGCGKKECHEGFELMGDGYCYPEGSIDSGLPDPPEDDADGDADADADADADSDADADADGDADADADADTSAPPMGDAIEISGTLSDLSGLVSSGDSLGVLLSEGDGKPVAGGEVAYPGNGGSFSATLLTFGGEVSTDSSFELMVNLDLDGDPETAPEAEGSSDPFFLEDDMTASGVEVILR